MWCIQTSWCKLCLWELLFDMTATGYDLHLKISAGWGSTGDEAPWTNLWVPAQLWCYCFPRTLAVMSRDAEPPRYPLTGCMKAPQTRARVDWPQGTKRFGSLPVVLWMSLGCAGRERGWVNKSKDTKRDPEGRVQCPNPCPCGTKWWMGLLPREASLTERLNGINKNLMWGYDVRSEFIGGAHEAKAVNECKWSPWLLYRKDNWWVCWKHKVR